MRTWMLSCGRLAWNRSQHALQRSHLAGRRETMGLDLCHTMQRDAYYTMHLRFLILSKFNMLYQCFEITSWERTYYTLGRSLIFFFN